MLCFHPVTQLAVTCNVTYFVSFPTSSLPGVSESAAAFGRCILCKYRGKFQSIQCLNVFLNQVRKQKCMNLVLSQVRLPLPISDHSDPLSKALIKAQEIHILISVYIP